MKDQFIKVMQGLADGVSIFPASAGFWGVIFDKIKAQQLKDIQPEWIQVYNSLKILNKGHTVIEKNTATVHEHESREYQYRVLRKQIDQRVRRMLLTAIARRLKGELVTVFAGDINELRTLKKDYEHILNTLDADLLRRHLEGHGTIYDSGRIRFSVLGRQDSFNWAEMRVPGQAINSCLVSPLAVYNRHRVIFDAFYLYASPSVGFVWEAEQELHRLEAGPDSEAVVVPKNDASTVGIRAMDPLDRLEPIDDYSRLSF